MVGPIIGFVAHVIGSLRCVVKVFALIRTSFRASITGETASLHSAQRLFSLFSLFSSAKVVIFKLRRNVAAFHQ